MLITEDTINEIIDELGIKITEQTSPVDLFESVKKLIIYSINSINQNDIGGNTVKSLESDVKGLLGSRG